MIRMKPNDAIELKEIPLVESYPPEDTLPEDGLYRYLLQPGEEHDDQRKRATRIWFKKTYRLSEIVSSPGNRVMYYLADGPERAFIKAELMIIPKDTELPPNFVQKMVKTFLPTKWNFEHQKNSSRTKFYTIKSLKCLCIEIFDNFLLANMTDCWIPKRKLFIVCWYLFLSQRNELSRSRKSWEKIRKENWAFCAP